MKHQQQTVEKWEIDTIQKRYHSTYAIDLTVEQAQSVYNYERLLTTPSSNHYFSFWEEFEFTLTSFQKILTNEQFEKYEKIREDEIRLIEEQMKRQDEEYVKQLQIANNLFEYYQSHLLMELKIPRTALWQLCLNDQPKINFLKAEYKKFLNDRKKYILVNHFRFKRRFQPNLLKLSLLNHNLICLLPDYHSFRDGMDNPTKFIAQYLEDKIKIDIDLLKNIKNIFQKLESFKKNLLSKKSEGWHALNNEVVEETKLHIMQIILLDKEKYLE